jgi:hypothetical protein
MFLRSPCCWCGLQLLNKLEDLGLHSLEYDAVSLGNRFPVFETTMLSLNVGNLLPSSISQKNGNVSYSAVKTENLYN